ncbi:NADPH-dependent 7-cyano-7-deazaguanine reductase QueF [Alteromonas sp. SM 2104]|nr:NADPH-dependent 7-cyano-7-deazaguanine reductase QueF [Alteromonas oceanisediminis]
MQSLTLGKSVDYIEHYTPELLQPVPRSINREKIGLSATQLPFKGVDLWNGYELSWLNAKGKPQIAILRCAVPANSPNLIESKSFKLYLNSFNQSVFDHVDVVKQSLTRDLSACAGVPVEVTLLLPDQFNQAAINDITGDCIDDLDVSIDHYEYSPSTLSTSSNEVSETLISHLLKSNCLITHQPDWGSVIIRYRGAQISREGLLKYLVSFRSHNEFHEQCVERIFCDLLQYCRPTALTVYARYTRRGGLDINPFRSNFEMPYANLRLARQ